MKEDIFFHDDTIIRQEKDKARALKASQWWKRKCAKGVCHYCGTSVRPAELTMDHIVPLSRGGRSTKGNVAACCKDCNNKKKGMLPIEWEEYIEKIKRDDSP